MFEIRKTIRDKFTFHFAREEMQLGIDALPHDPFVVLRGYRRTSAELYYELADRAALAYLIDCMITMIWLFALIELLEQRLIVSLSFSWLQIES